MNTRAKIELAKLREESLKSREIIKELMQKINEKNTLIRQLKFDLDVQKKVNDPLGKMCDGLKKENERLRAEIKQIKEPKNY